MTFFGDPAARDGEPKTPIARLQQTPTCLLVGEPLRASMRRRTRGKNPKSPAGYTPPVESVVYPQITGCDLV